MKNVTEYLKPSDLPRKIDFLILICFAKRNSRLSRYDITIPRQAVVQKNSETDLNICYLEYLEYIVENYYNLPESMIFADERVFNYLNKNSQHSIRDNIIKNINSLEYITEPISFGKQKRIEADEKYIKWCCDYGIEKKSQKYNELPIYAINRLSILNNPIDLYESLLNFGKNNKKNLCYIEYSWMYFFKTETKISSLYKPINHYIKEQDVDQEKIIQNYENKIYIEAVTVCLNYSHILEQCISNKNHFDKWIIVTSEDDILTQNMCKKYNLECVISKRIHESGEYIFTHPRLKTQHGLKPAKAFFEKAPLAKGKAINDGLEKCNISDWIVHIDADILLPENFREHIKNEILDKNSLYGLGKRTNEFNENIGSWKNGLGMGVDGAIGWFQMFHSSAFKNIFNNKYSEESADTWWDDMIFAEKFNKNQKCFKYCFAKTISENSNSYQVGTWSRNSVKQKISK